MAAEFIFESGVAVKDVITKKTIRSHAMKHFKERQRKERSRESSTSATRKKPRHVRETVSAVRPLLPAPNGAQEPTVCFVEESREGSNSEQADPEPQHLGRAINNAEFDLTEIAGTDVVLVQSSHVWRQQLGQLFLTSYYADSIVGAIHKDWHNFEPGDAAGRTLNTARDALCLIDLGTRFRDERLLDEGFKRHCIGLRLLRERIETPEGVVCDGLLDACYTLAHCQIYQSVSILGKGWRIHLEGLHLLLRRRGMKSIKSPFGHATLHKIRQIVAMDQLLKRKTSFLSSPEWLVSKRQNDSSLYAPALQLTDLALQLSGALEDTDAALQARIAGKPVADDKLRDILLHMRSLEYEFDLWVFNFYHRSDVAQKPCTLTDVTEYPHFETQCRDMALCFPTVYSFSDLLSATTHCYLFILYLVMRMAQMDLAGLHPAQLETKSEALAAEADEYATHLCRSLAYLSLPQHRSAGVLACGGPLYWASTWYERSGDPKKLQACQSIRELLERDCPTPLNLKAPVFTWWMIPSIFEDQGAVVVRGASGIVAGSPDLNSDSTTASGEVPESLYMDSTAERGYMMPLASRLIRNVSCLGSGII